MEKENIAKYWVDSSEIDFKAMNNLFDSKDYVWSLFMGHLVIEKLLKALAILKGNETVPKIHDLNKLAKMTGTYFDNDKKDILDIVTSFNIEARYPDYKYEFYKKCDFYFTSKYIEEIKEMRKWLLEQLKK